MPKQFKTARKMNKLKLKDAAVMLGVSQPTLSSWESGRKSPTIDGLLKMSDLYKVSTDFLLGRTKTAESMISDKIVPNSNLRIMHGQPVWSKEYGWMIVDSVKEVLIINSEQYIPFVDAPILYHKVWDYSEPIFPQTEPIKKNKIKTFSEVWVEPISTDIILRVELIGWYKPKEHWVENEFGNKFFYDTYESKWLCFEKICTLTLKNE